MARSSQRDDPTLKFPIVPRLRFLATRHSLFLTVAGLNVSQKKARTRGPRCEVAARSHPGDYWSLIVSLYNGEAALAGLGPEPTALYL